MWSLLPALLACQRRRGTGREAASTLVDPGCRVLTCTPPTLISAVSISCAVSSPEEADLLATRANRLAAEHGLAATVTVVGRRLRAKFVRLDGVQEASDGASQALQLPADAPKSPPR